MCLAFCIILQGCGYTTKSTLPASIKTIHVEPIANKIDFTRDTRRNLYLPLLEVDARNAIIDRFLFDGNLRIAEPETADLILKGELVSYQRSVLRYTDNEDVQEYRIHISVSFEMFNAKNNETEWTESGFTGEATYYVTGPKASSEDEAIDGAIEDLARRIVARTIEDW